MNINELMNINDVRESATIFPRPCKLTFDLLTLKESHVTCDVGYLCANFGLPRRLCFRVIPDVRDKRAYRRGFTLFEHDLEALAENAQFDLFRTSCSEVLIIYTLQTRNLQVQCN